MDEDLRDLLMAWWGGETEAGRADQLLSRLSTDSDFRRAFIAEIRMMGMLRAVQSSEPRWLKIEDELGWSTAVDSECEPLDKHPEPRPIARSRPRLRRRWWWTMAASSALVVMLLLALYPRQGAPPRLASRPAQPAPEVKAKNALALVITLDAVEWEAAAGPHPQEGSVLAKGRFRIRSGRILLSLFTGVEVVVEGPADFELVSFEQVRCHRGKLRARIPKGSEGFLVSGPGALVVDLGTEFGLNVESAGRSRGKVFEGEVEAAVVDPEGNWSRSQLIGESESFEIDPLAGRILAVGEQDRFATPLDREPPPLLLDVNYATTVMKSRPWGYWRFEAMAGGAVPNEVPGRPPLMSIGPIRLTSVEPGGNHSAVFDTGNRDQNLSLSDLWEPKRTPGFAVELWFAPTGIRRAALVSLVAPRDTDHHLVLLETTFLPRPNAGHPPGKIRFLHRWPTGTHGGENLYSETYYVPYRWHYIVAQISYNRMELFMDGAKMSSIPLDPGYSTAPCQVLLGKLATTGGRPFAGQMDEVALYERPLTTEEIRDHYHLASQGVRPTRPSGPAANP